jgi:hypothetical protein
MTPALTLSSSATVNAKQAALNMLLLPLAEGMRLLLLSRKAGGASFPAIPTVTKGCNHICSF